MLLQFTPPRASLVARLERFEDQLEARTTLSFAPFCRDFDLFCTSCCAKWDMRASGKHVLHTSTKLAYPDLAKDFIPHMDASAEASGDTLRPEDRAGNLRLLTCTSRKLIPAERSYPTHEREIPALVHALKKWRHYLLGWRVRVFTDNTALR